MNAREQAMAADNRTASLQRLRDCHVGTVAATRAVLQAHGWEPCKVHDGKDGECFDRRSTRCFSREGALADVYAKAFTTPGERAEWRRLQRE